MKRSRFEIIYDILSCLERGSSTKTRLMYAANLDWRNFSRYASYLEEEGLIAYNGGCYTITEKGRTLLNKLRESLELLCVLS